MLSKAERQWAVNAKMRLSHKDDLRCGKCGVHCFVPWAPCLCVMTKDDVTWEIEFQSRVAAKLAYEVENACAFGFCWMNPAHIALREARLQVEEEMDGSR